MEAQAPGAPRVRVAAGVPGPGIRNRVLHGRSSEQDAGVVASGPAQVPVPRAFKGKDGGRSPQAKGAQRHGLRPDA